MGKKKPVNYKVITEICVSPPSNVRKANHYYLSCDVNFLVGMSWDINQFKLGRIISLG